MLKKILLWNNNSNKIEYTDIIDYDISSVSPNNIWTKKTSRKN